MCNPPPISPVSPSYKFNVIITTPHTLLSDWPVFQPIKWRYVIVDEAHSLKNADSQLAAHVSVRAPPLALLFTQNQHAS